jgi:hypothetical protein
VAQAANLGARAEPELVQNVADMDSDRTLGEDQCFGDLAIGQRLRYQGRHFPLAAGMDRERTL